VEFNEVAIADDLEAGLMAAKTICDRLDRRIEKLIDKYERILRMVVEDIE
jgi:hypothetical protein